jgi:hypothetical protein
MSSQYWIRLKNKIWWQDFCHRWQRAMTSFCHRWQEWWQFIVIGDKVMTQWGQGDDTLRTRWWPTEDKVMTKWGQGDDQVRTKKYFISNPNSHCAYKNSLRWNLMQSIRILLLLSGFSILLFNKSLNSSIGFFSLESGIVP